MGFGLSARFILTRDREGRRVCVDMLKNICGLGDACKYFD